MSEYSVTVNDWHDEKWEITGRNVMYSFYEENPKEAEKDGHTVEDGKVQYLDEVADDHFPMMNYAYPLYSEPDEEAIIRICRETNCTVVEDTETGDFFLALCGGGMDLSQDIALAYILAEERIPSALACVVSTQEGLSKSGEKWLLIMKKCEEALLDKASQCKTQAERIKEAIREYKNKRRGSLLDNASK